ncbi:MAG: cupin domain-containing protein [Flavobacteriales bacterium]|jgi:hypothetical protein
MDKAFSFFELKTGLLWDDSYNDLPCRLYGLRGAYEMRLMPCSTYFIYVQRGTVLLNRRWPLYPGMFASATRAVLEGDELSEAIIIERIGYFGAMLIGGPIEAQGRLKYIDGCTDSLLISPLMFGDPCLNHLHFPPDVKQTMHTHPSVRIGMVTKGWGKCETPDGLYDLRPGLVFVIHTDGQHRFLTDREAMDVIAFHADSDFGPTHEDHPMINRTIVDGVSAKDIEEIRTK